MIIHLFWSWFDQNLQLFCRQDMAIQENTFKVLQIVNLSHIKSLLNGSSKCGLCIEWVGNAIACGKTYDIIMAHTAIRASLMQNTKLPFYQI